MKILVSSPRLRTTICVRLVTPFIKPKKSRRQPFHRFSQVGQRFQDGESCVVYTTSWFPVFGRQCRFCEGRPWVPTLWLPCCVSTLMSCWLLRRGFVLLTTFHSKLPLVLCLNRRYLLPFLPAATMSRPTKSLAYPASASLPLLSLPETNPP